uniref:Uncharacterized protein LOC112830120 n=2 Tax=Otariidae TaxID=9702 RepID=A0A3Q7R5E8_CALUR|nr:uncharacterized protein LOC112830120 [Callorhinus ursinus]XP_025735597.1 uncharacterized protein LOC112830120 [Callorhinus ursinus]
MPLALQHVAQGYKRNVADGRCRRTLRRCTKQSRGGNINQAPSVKTRQGSKSPFGGRFGDTIITCTVRRRSEIFDSGTCRGRNQPAEQVPVGTSGRVSAVPFQPEAGHASDSRSRRPPGAKPEPARGGSLAALPARAQAASGCTAGLARPRPPDPGPEGEHRFTCSPLWLPPPPPPRRSPTLPGCRPITLIDCDLLSRETWFLALKRIKFGERHKQSNRVITSTEIKFIFKIWRRSILFNLH